MPTRIRKMEIIDKTASYGMTQCKPVSEDQIGTVIQYFQEDDIFSFYLDRTTIAFVESSNLRCYY